MDGVIFDSTATLRLHRAVWRDGTPTTEAAVGALDAFCPALLDPLDFGVTAACLDEVGEGAHDPDRRPREWHRYLRARDLPEDVDAGPFYRDATRHEVAAVDAAAMRRAADGLLSQSCEHLPGSTLDWTEMYVTAAWVRLVGAQVLGDRRPLVVDDLDGHRLALEIPVTERDGAPWVVGPLWWLGACPIELWVFNDEGLLTLEVLVRWSLWWKDQEAGRRLLDDIVEGLVAEGWRAT